MSKDKKQSRNEGGLLGLSVRFILLVFCPSNFQIERLEQIN